MAKQRDWYKTTQDLAGQIMDRKPFQYDQDKDAMYQAFRDRYVSQGRKAMADTMGQAAGLTGGYANTYAQNVGQQTYNDYLTGLQDQSLNLYDRALAAYNAEGQALQDKLGVAQNMYSMGLAAAGGSGRYSRGGTPDTGDLPIDTTESGDIPDGQVPDGQVPDGQIPDGQKGYDIDYDQIRLKIYYAAEKGDIQKAMQAMDYAAGARNITQKGMEYLQAWFDRWFPYEAAPAQKGSRGGGAIRPMARE